jgi:hypothetical protein
MPPLFTSGRVVPHYTNLHQIVQDVSDARV